MLKICRKYSTMKGIVVDLPQVLENTQDLLKNENEVITKRLTFHSSDFFKDELPKGDLYILSRILHDWKPDKIDYILKKLYQALPENGALLIAEMLLDDDKCGPLSVQLQSLNMLVQTEGKERTFQEYKSLLSQIGFSHIQSRLTGSYLDVILAIKCG